MAEVAAADLAADAAAHAGLVAMLQRQHQGANDPSNPSQKNPSMEGYRFMINDAGPKGLTPLAVACVQGDLTVVGILLNAGADPAVECDLWELPNDFGGEIKKRRAFPLFIAARQKEGRATMVKQLLAWGGVDVNQGTTDAGTTALCMACYVGNLQAVQMLLDCDEIEVNKARADDGQTPLNAACGQGYTEIVAMLLARDEIEVNKARTDDGATPLFLACHQGRAEIVAMLLARDEIDANQACTNDGATPLYVACRHGHIAVVKMLLVHAGVEVNKVRTDDGATPLFIACSEGHVDIVKALLGCSQIDVNMAKADNGAGWLLDRQMNFLVVANTWSGIALRPLPGHTVTPLCIACLSGHTEVVSVLLAFNRLIVTTCTSQRHVGYNRALTTRYKELTAILMYAYQSFGYGNVLLQVYMSQALVCMIGSKLKLLAAEDVDYVFEEDHVLGCMIGPKLKLLAEYFGDVFEEDHRYHIILSSLFSGFFCYSFANTLSFAIEQIMLSVFNCKLFPMKPIDGIKWTTCSIIGAVLWLVVETAMLGKTHNSPGMQSGWMYAQGARAANIYRYNYLGLFSPSFTMLYASNLFVIMYCALVALGALGAINAVLISYCGFDKYLTDDLTELHNAACNGHLAIVQQLLASGMERDIHANGDGWETAEQMAIRTSQNPVAEWFRATAGWSALHVAASCRLPTIAAAALRRGQVDPDDPRFTSLKEVLSVVDLDLPWECAVDTIKMMVAATKGWHRTTHWLHHDGVRQAVHTIMLVDARLNQRDHGTTTSIASMCAGMTGTSEQCRIPHLPTELWFSILGFVLRSWWAVPPPPRPAALQ